MDKDLFILRVKEMRTYQKITRGNKISTDTKRTEKLEDVVDRMLQEYEFEKRQLKLF